MENKLPSEKFLDFDNGSIIKSPCRDCSLKKQLPECSNSCKKLILLQSVLADTISSSNYISEFETYSISSQN